MLQLQSKVNGNKTEKKIFNDFMFSLILTIFPWISSTSQFIRDVQKVNRVRLIIIPRSSPGSSCYLSRVCPYPLLHSISPQSIHILEDLHFYILGTRDIFQLSNDMPSFGDN